MEEEEDDYFQSEEFLDILERYEQATATGHMPYMDSDELLDVADYYMSKGKYTEAQKAAELSLDLHPDDKDSVTMMADIMFESQQWEEGIVWLNRVLDNNPFDTQAWVNLTDCYLQCKQYAEALDSTEYTLAIEPEHPQAIMQKGFALMNQERYQEADDVYRHYLEMHPDDDLALYHTAFNLCFLEKHDEANDMLIRAENISQGLSPEQLHICLQRAYTEARLGHLQEALDALERSRKYATRDDNVEYNMLTAHIYLLCHHNDKAADYFALAIAESKDVVGTMLAIAQVYMDGQVYTTALQIYMEVENMVSAPEYDAERDEIIKAISPAQAFCCYQTGLREEYLYYLQVAVRLNPHDTEIFFRDVFPYGALPEDYPYYAARDAKP